MTGADPSTAGVTLRSENRAWRLVLFSGVLNPFAAPSDLGALCISFRALGGRGGFQRSSPPVCGLAWTESADVEARARSCVYGNRRLISDCAWLDTCFSAGRISR